MQSAVRLSVQHPARPPSTRTLRTHCCTAVAMHARRRARTCPCLHLHMHMQVNSDKPGGPDPKWRIKTKCMAYHKLDESRCSRFPCKSGQGDPTSRHRTGKTRPVWNPTGLNCMNPAGCGFQSDRNPPGPGFKVTETRRVRFSK